LSAETALAKAALQRTVPLAGLRSEAAHQNRALLRSVSASAGIVSFLGLKEDMARALERA